MRLDLGGGVAPAPGHTNIDIIPSADIIWDLNKGLPSLPSSIDGIRCHQVLEHLDTIIPLMNDCYIVMKEGAIMEISTPLAGTIQDYQDPTHKRHYVKESFLYFTKDSPFAKEQQEYGITARFYLDACEIIDKWMLQVVLRK